MIGIIGGGFGLFSWMPALCQYYPEETILIESRHKEKFDSRPELQKYKDRIIWCGPDKLLIEKSELLILAIPPSQVYSYLDCILKSTKLKRIIVEKPICETPEKSEEFIKQIENKGIKICSSYLFLYTEWFKELNPNKQYEIVWFKKNNNPKGSWKNNYELGGGEIFYKIHLLSIQTQNINFSTTFIPIEVDRINEITVLDIKDRKFSYFELFKSENEEDNRIPYIKQLLYDFENNYEKVNKLMKQTNELWKQVEQKLS